MSFGEELGVAATGGGIFEVRPHVEMPWSKKAAGRFPEPCEIKQLIRDRIAPGMDPGHSDCK